MSTNFSYFSKNNTIISNRIINTGRNPVTEIFYGGSSNISVSSENYSRFIFDLDLTLLLSKINDGTITTGCTDTMSHTLRMTNVSTFEDFLNVKTSEEKIRATSFDLILFRIPYINLDPTQPQNWDEGVGYDFSNFLYEFSETDKNFSTRPSNWSARTTIESWQEPGLYNNKNLGTIPYSSLTIVDEQHFEFGNENISFNMTNEINGIINGSITNVAGWGIAFKPQLENITGLTDTFVVQFFTRHTQTFYEPYLETNYNDLIEDDRNLFSIGKQNKLYLFLYEDGNPINLDYNPVVDILNQNGDLVPGMSGLTTCKRTRGVYEVIVPPLSGYKTPCTFSDRWRNLVLNGFTIPTILNDFVLRPFKNSIQIGTESLDPKIYGFDFYGIKQDEKILNTDIRKVGVIIKEAFSTQKLLQKVDSYYRIYVREGQTEVQVQDWTKINKTPNEYFFIFDTRDKIPNEYFIDIKLENNYEVNTFKRQIKFQVVDNK
jgi:hypothetical protein